MYRVLTRIYWNDEALSQIPPYVQVASKQGAVNASRSEVVLVNAPSGDYVFCVITKNQQDQSWEDENEGFVLLRDVSRTLWKYFEPDSEWQPAEGMHQY
jgi:beta-lactamase class A